MAVETAKQSGRMIPDQSDGRHADTAAPNSRGGWTKGTPIKAVQAVAVSKYNQAFHVFENGLGQASPLNVLHHHWFTLVNRALASVTSDASD
jgi:hypothetical protein